MRYSCRVVCDWLVGYEPLIGRGPPAAGIGREPWRVVREGGARAAVGGDWAGHRGSGFSVRAVGSGGGGPRLRAGPVDKQVQGRYRGKNHTVRIYWIMDEYR